MIFYKHSYALSVELNIRQLYHLLGCNNLSKKKKGVPSMAVN